jgi:hypothetical protein
VITSIRRWWETKINKQRSASGVRLLAAAAVVVDPNGRYEKERSILINDH